MNICIRVDSSHEIGVGHIYRCISFAKKLRNDGHQCFFITRSFHGNRSDLIELNGFKNIKLNPKPIINDDSKNPYSKWLGASQKDDAAETLKYINSLSIDILIIDHYAINREYEEILFPFLKKIVVIDDLCNRRHLCNFLIDQTPGRQAIEYDRLVPKECIKLCGEKFLILRDEFINKEIDLSPSKYLLRKFLINFGGTDEHNYTQLALSHLNKIFFDEEIECNIILSSSCLNLSKIQNYSKLLNFKCNFHIDTDKVAELIRFSDIGIGAGGISALERCALGLPSLLYLVADNQKSIINSLVRKNSAIEIKDKSFFAFKSGWQLISNKSNYFKLKKACSKLVKNDGLDLIIRNIFHEVG